MNTHIILVSVHLWLWSRTYIPIAFLTTMFCGIRGWDGQRTLGLACNLPWLPSINTKHGCSFMGQVFECGQAWTCTHWEFKLVKGSFTSHVLGQFAIHCASVKHEAWCHDKLQNLLVAMGGAWCLWGFVLWHTATLSERCWVNWWFVNKYHSDATVTPPVRSSWSALNAHTRSWSSSYPDCKNKYIYIS